MKIKKVIYKPFVSTYVDGLPTFYIIKETFYFGFSFDYELIGRDVYGFEPFYSAEEMEERINYLNLKQKIMELVLFSLLGLIAVLFFVNHLFFGGKLLKRENTGWLVDVVKYGTIILVILILVKYVIYN